MNLNIIKRGVAFMLAALLVCGCGGGELASSLLHSKSAILREDEVVLAFDSSMLTMHSQMDKTQTSFNLQNWPLDCPAATEQKAECKEGEAVGLRNVQISGLVLIIDPEKMPWLALNNQRNIKSLRIEAEKIVVKGKLNLPSTSLEILADEMIFNEAAAIDVTPVAQIGHAPFHAELNAASNGVDGLPGSRIKVETDKMTVIGANDQAVLIANGGQGQKAGDGWGLRDPAVAASAENTAGGMAQVPGQEAGVVFVNKHCSGRYDTRTLGPRSRNLDIVPMEVVYDITNKEQGVAQWPADGRDAIPGGFPGVGGAGGRIAVSIQNVDSKVDEKMFSARGGQQGEASGMWYGQKGGLPNPAFHRMVSGGCHAEHSDRSPHSVNMVRRDQRDGANAMSPEHPISPSTAGTVEIRTETQLAFTDSFFKLKLRRVKDLYFNRHFEDAARNLIDFEQKIQNKSGAEETENKIMLRSQLLRLKSNLVANRDYFGRGLNDAPSFAFEFDVERYNSQIKNAMSTYYLSRLFAKHYEDRHNRIEILNSTLDNVSESLNMAVDDLDKSQSKISSFEVRLASIKANQKSIEDELAVLKDRIEQEARANVRRRHANDGLFKFVEIAASICQVVPVGQPALAIGASLVKTMVKGPKEQTLKGAMEFAGEVYGGFDQLNDTKKWEESQKSWKEFFAKTDLGQLKGKSLKEKGEYLKGIYKELSPTIEKVSEAIRPWNQPTVSATEIEMEIQKLQDADPMFQSVAAKLRDLVAKKAEFEKDLRDFSALLEVLMGKITSYVAISASLSGEALDSNLNDDSELKEVYEQLASDNEERILLLYDEAVRSYNYMTLSNLPRPMNIFSLRAKLKEILDSQTDVSQATIALTAFYESQIGQIRDALADQINQASPLLITFEGSNVLHLTEEEIELLSSGNEVSIPLNDEFYSKKENVRIVSLEVAENSYGFEEIPKESASRYPSIYLSFRLGETGSFNLPNSQTYVYPKIGNLFRWDHTFQMSGGRWESQSNRLSREFKGILSTLVTNDRTLQYSSVFSSHAGITDLKIQMQTRQGPYKLNALGVRVNYLYSGR